MSGIGDTLRSERRRQGRTLADAAAETRVRESYLAALEEEDFDVLGGDVYSRGFIRLYGKYLGLDAESLVQQFRDHHERPAEVTAIPGATIDEVMPPFGGLPRLAATPPVYAAVGVVALLVVLFIVLRGGGDDGDAPDANAPGPEPAAAAADAGPDLPTPGAPTEGDTSGLQTAAPDLDGGVDQPVGEAGEAFEEVEIVVTAVQAIELTVTRGQPPLSGLPLAPGEVRTLFDPANEAVSFTISDFGGAEITVNGNLLASPQLAGRTVEITCTVGETDCDARPL
ncbi:MAG TPA: helix-turn-helix domain-containing protein [Euzebya sp.]|nr:helix-turn-helix domain-containing protein [Euzebya sp.]